MASEKFPCAYLFLIKIHAAKFVKNLGVDSVTIHLREDRRHIKDIDAKKICSINKLFVSNKIKKKFENMLKEMLPGMISEVNAING